MAAGAPSLHNIKHPPRGSWVGQRVPVTVIFDSCMHGKVTGWPRWTLSLVLSSGNWEPSKLIGLGVIWGAETQSGDRQGSFYSVQAPPFQNVPAMLFVWHICTVGVWGMHLCGRLNMHGGLRYASVCHILGALHIYLYNLQYAYMM